MFSTKARGRPLLAPLTATLLLGLCAGAAATPIDYTSIDWSIHALIDNSETVLGVNQADRPRDMRGLELSFDRNYLYAGYNNPSSGFEVRRLDLSQTGNASFVNRVAGLRGKSIATDDRGRVYLAEGNAIEVRSADLSTSLGTYAGVTKSEGIAVVREAGGDLVLYASDRTDGTLTRYVLTEGTGDTVTAFTADAGFGPNGDGTVVLGSDLRGVTVDADGRIWVAGRGTDTVYRVSADGLTVATVAASNPFDVAAFDGTVLVSLENALEIAVLNQGTLAPLASNLTIPFGALGLGALGSLAGIAVDPLLGLFVANESGQTSPAFPDGTDDNDPILFGAFFDPPVSATGVPEPATLALVLLGVASLRKRTGTARAAA